MTPFMAIVFSGSYSCLGWNDSPSIKGVIHSEDEMIPFHGYIDFSGSDSCLG